MYSSWGFDGSVVEILTVSRTEDEPFFTTCTFPWNDTFDVYTLSGYMHVVSHMQVARSCMHLISVCFLDNVPAPEAVTSAPRRCCLHDTIKPVNADIVSDRQVKAGLLGYSANAFRLSMLTNTVKFNVLWDVV